MIAIAASLAAMCLAIIASATVPDLFAWLRHRRAIRARLARLMMLQDEREYYELWLDDGFVPPLAQADSDETRKGNVVGVGSRHSVHSLNSSRCDGVTKP